MSRHRSSLGLSGVLLLAAGFVHSQEAGPRPRAGQMPPRPVMQRQPNAAQGRPEANRGKTDGHPPIAGQAIEYLKKNNPEKFQQLMQLRKTDQQAFAKELRELVQAWRQHYPKQRRRPVSREEQACRELSERYHQTENEEEKETLRQDLTEAVEQAFEMRVKAMEARIQRMEKELEKFNERLELLKQNRRAVCDDRLQELLRPPELDWDGDW